MTSLRRRRRSKAPARDATVKGSGPARAERVGSPAPGKSDGVGYTFQRNGAARTRTNAAIAASRSARAVYRVMSGVSMNGAGLALGG